MSGGLAPSKSTIYVSNLPFSLTNNDLHKIFEKYGKVVKVTVVKDKNGRSRGVAFVLFLERDSAYKCVRAVSNTQMFGRTLKCSIAKDNGRTTEFIKRKEYKDKSRCYECGEEGHLSYACSKNLLGEREPPPKKKRRNQEGEEEDEEERCSDDDSGTENAELDSLSTAIQFQQAKITEKISPHTSASTSADTTRDQQRRKTYKKDAYFSDEEELA